MTIERQKRCYLCRDLKPLSEYTRNHRRPDGRRAECRDCDRLLKDRRRRPGREREVEEIERLLQLDPLDAERIKAEYGYSWFRKHAIRDPEFDLQDNETLLEARLRWIQQRNKRAEHE